MAEKLGHVAQEWVIFTFPESTRLAGVIACDSFNDTDVTLVMVPSVKWAEAAQSADCRHKAPVTNFQSVP